ncbi:hypothetical protein KR084_005393, partial [Drosophila pseudotakahashii]
PAYMEAEIRGQYLQLMVRALPNPVQNKIVCMKNNYLEQVELEQEFYDQVFQLEMSFNGRYEVIFSKRKAIIMGTFEPGEMVPNYYEHTPMDNWTADDIRKRFKKFKSVSSDTKGIPDFWLTVFRNTMLADMVQPQDVPVLRRLVDISIKYEKKYSFTLCFHFAKNKYFHNAVLTKQYFLKSDIDPKYPFSFEGPEIDRCKGCKINWRHSMDLTVEKIKKIQKHRGDGDKRTIHTTSPVDSFFNFFNPPPVRSNKECKSANQKILETDFKMGHYLRVRIIPKAVLYFTGDIVDSDDGEDNSDEEEFETDDSD